MSTASRGPYPKGIAKRDEILRAALRVIAQHGYRNTSIRELADAVGLSQAGLLHYFGSKEELFTEVLRERDAADKERSQAEHPDLMNQYVAVVRHNADVPGLVQLYSTLTAVAGDPQHSAHPFFVERYAGLRESFAQYIRQRRADGTVAADVDPDKVARIMIALSDGLQVQAQFDTTVNVAELLEHLWSLLQRQASTSTASHRQ